jgi:site-specific DNA-cytosine methylase
VPENAILPHNILCTGFPCQPFSIAGVSKKLSPGKKQGFENKEQGNLFFKLADLIDHHQPDAFMRENVKVGNREILERRENESKPRPWNRQSP